MSYLACPECKLTVPAAAYYLRGDECPRCLATMEKRKSFRPETTAAVNLTLSTTGGPAPATG